MFDQENLLQTGSASPLKSLGFSQLKTSFKCMIISIWKVNENFVDRGKDQTSSHGQEVFCLQENKILPS